MQGYLLAGVNLSDPATLRSNLEQLQELVLGEGCLLQDTLEQWRRQVSRVNGDGDPKLGLSGVKKAGVTASLMMNIEAGPLERANDML